MLLDDARVKCFIGGFVVALFLTNVFTCEATHGAQCKQAGLTGIDFERCVNQKAEGTWDPETFEPRENRASVKRCRSTSQ